jgi:hypothetical protein
MTFNYIQNDFSIKSLYAYKMCKYCFCWFCGLSVNRRDGECIWHDGYAFCSDECRNFHDDMKDNEDEKTKDKLIEQRRGERNEDNFFPAACRIWGKLKWFSSGSRRCNICDKNTRMFCYCCCKTNIDEKYSYQRTHNASVYLQCDVTDSKKYLNITDISVLRTVQRNSSILTSFPNLTMLFLT